MAAKRIPKVEVDGLQLRTLSGTYEASRAVLRAIDWSKIASYDSLKRRLIQLAKSPDDVKALYTALESIHQCSDKLGRTTLIQPATHPLVQRVPWTPPPEKE